VQGVPSIPVYIFNLAINKFLFAYYLLSFISVALRELFLYASSSIPAELATALSFHVSKERQDSPYQPNSQRPN
jgi:hypothetical protein